MNTRVVKLLRKRLATLRTLRARAVIGAPWVGHDGVIRAAEDAQGLLLVIEALAIEVAQLNIVQDGRDGSAAEVIEELGEVIDLALEGDR